MKKIRNDFIESKKVLFSVTDETPIKRIDWIKQFAAEVFGTLLLALMLAGLSTIVTKGGKTIEEFMFHPFIVAFYAGFVVIGIVLALFLRWSCDLNPAVTIYKMLVKESTVKFGFFKIVAQIIGAIMAGLLMYAIGHGVTGGQANKAIDAIAVARKELGYLNGTKFANAGIAGGSALIFGIELVITIILLFPIFSPNMRSKYKFFFVCGIIALAVWIAVPMGTAAINPARGFAQQVPALFFGPKAGLAGDHATWANITSSTIAMLAGTIFAPFAFLGLQFLAGPINRWFSELIAYRNFKEETFKKPKK